MKYIKASKENLNWVGKEFPTDLDRSYNQGVEDVSFIRCLNHRTAVEMINENAEGDECGECVRLAAFAEGSFRAIEEGKDIARKEAVAWVAERQKSRLNRDDAYGHGYNQATFHVLEGVIDYLENGYRVAGSVGCDAHDACLGGPCKHPYGK